MLNNARQACIAALMEWEKGRKFSDEILHETLKSARLSSLDRAFFMETFFGILRNLSRLDFLIGELRDGSLDAGTREVVRLGIYQIFHMRTAPHAAVNETVNLAGRARGLVNALLRRALREKDLLEHRVNQAGLSVAQSHPEFLLERWTRVFGEASTRALCEWNNQPAEVHVRANSLKTTVDELLRMAPDARPSPAHPLAIDVDQLPVDWIERGLCYVQDPSTLMACDLLAPLPGTSCSTPAPLRAGKPRISRRS